MNDYEKQKVDRVVIIYDERTNQVKKNIRVCDLVVYAKTNDEGKVEQFNLGDMLDKLVEDSITIKNQASTIETLQKTVNVLKEFAESQNEINKKLSQQIKNNL